MAKKNDPFERFRNLTLGSGNSLSDAISGVARRDESHEEHEEAVNIASSPTPVQPKVSKNATRKLVSFHLDKAVYLKLGMLKVEMGTTYDDLYNEAVNDLLAKYGKM